ncbi:MAG: SLC13 family permease [Candidatus Thorarchaeota archaeon]|jgi:Na+/H+ antiporter NhaD/arsenite permease-like protein
MAAEWIILVFVVTYIAISSEKVNRTATALLGMGLAGIVLWATGAGVFSDIVEHIEWSTILFVTSMFVIVTIAASSGMLQFFALNLTRTTRGDTRKLFVSLLGFVFIISLFFDTTSTMLIMGPLTIELCKALDIDFRPFLISEAVTCNFASIPSIVGAVPNLLIAEKAHVDPGFLLITLLPLAVILFVISIPFLLRIFEDQLQPSEEDLVSHMMLINPQYMIRSKSDFYLSIVAMIILVLGFTIGPGLEPQLQPALIAITVASVLLILAREWVDEILKRVNWGTIFFLVGLFGLVAALEITGVIDALGVGIGNLIGGNVFLGIFFMTWVPAILSAVIDNIPVSAVLAPIAAQFAIVSPILPIALIFAVNVGGFLLPIGSPANILALVFAEKERKPISMKDFAKVATPLAFLMLTIGTAWLLVLGLFV